MKRLETKERAGRRFRLQSLVSVLVAVQLALLGSVPALGQARGGAEVSVVKSEKKIRQSIGLESKANPAIHSPVTYCANKAAKEEFSLPGEKNAVKLDKCYRGRAHSSCLVSAMKAESIELKTDYANLISRKYPETRSLESLCGRSIDSLRTDADLARAFRVRFKALRDVFTSRISCASTLEKSLSDVRFVSLVTGDAFVKSIVGSFQSDMKGVVQDLEELNALSEKVTATAAALDSLMKVHLASCELSKVGVDHSSARQSSARQTSTRRNSSAGAAFSPLPR